MRTKHIQKQQPTPEPARVRAKRDPLWCLWRSRTHAPCHKIAEPGLPFCAYHVAATFGMARGATIPDAETRALFDEVIEKEEIRSYE